MRPANRKSLQSRRQQARKRQHRRGILAFAAIALIMTTGLAGYQLLRQSFVERDELTLCRLDQQIPRETVLLLDATDPLTQSQSVLLQSEIRRLLNQALIDERFSLFVIDEQADSATARLVLCNPGNGTERSALIANKRRLQQQWQQAFYDRLLSSADNQLATAPASQSPILESIQQVSAQALSQSNAPEKRLIVASDMLQHTPELSHYRIGTATLDQPYLSLVKPELTGVDVEILYLWRKQASARQHPGHLQFWESYIRQASGTVTRVQMVN